MSSSVWGQTRLTPHTNITFMDKCEQPGGAATPAFNTTRGQITANSRQNPRLRWSKGHTATLERRIKVTLKWVCSFAKMHKVKIDVILKT